MKRDSSSKDKALPSWKRDVAQIESMLAEAKALLQSPWAAREIPETGGDVVVLADISGGREKYPIRAINGVDKYPAPTTFTYITDAMHSSSCLRPPVDESNGCGCVRGCSDFRKCPCVLRNVGGQIPFNENGLILTKLEQGIHECGPACKCPPTCMNRVGQSGPWRQRLEIFKTEKTGWGVRSRDAIPEGGFICEYVGEILTEAEAERRVGEDGYLYDIVGGFTIDGAKYGNVGRFVNHSCSPNAFAQNVYCGYGEEKKIMPRIMFFAGTEIAPLEEIFYDYNYTKGSVKAHGVVKEIPCHCGSRVCRKRLY